MQLRKNLTLNKYTLTAGLLLTVSLSLLVWLDLAFIFPLQKLDKPNLNNDFGVFWLGTRTLWQGGNPYDYAPNGVYQSLAAAQGGVADNFLSPLFVTIIFAPFALFPLAAAALLWLLFNQLLLVVSVGLTLRLVGQRLTPNVILIAAGLVIFWRYSFQVMILNNLSIMMLFGVVLSYYLSRTGKPFWAGGVAAFLLVKPQLVFFIVPLLLVLPEKNANGKVSWFNWQRWLGFGATGLVLAAYSFALRPAWITEWLQSTSDRTTAQFDSEMTSVRSLIVLFTSNVGLLYFSIAGLGALAVLAFWWRNRHNVADFVFVLGVVICANLFFAPYTRSYDFTLFLLPLLAGYFTVRQYQKSGFPLTLLWLPLMILHWPLHLLSLNTTFAWENIITLTIFCLTLLAWRVKRQSDVTRQAADTISSPNAAPSAIPETAER
jgi:hypothetical protein